MFYVRQLYMSAHLLCSAPLCSRTLILHVWAFTRAVTALLKYCVKSQGGTEIKIIYFKILKNYLNL